MIKNKTAMIVEIIAVFDFLYVGLLRQLQKYMMKSWAQAD
jgi:hypothetical protein